MVAAFTPFAILWLLRRVGGAAAAAAAAEGLPSLISHFLSEHEHGVPVAVQLHFPKGAVQGVQFVQPLP